MSHPTRRSRRGQNLDGIERESISVASSLSSKENYTFSEFQQDVMKVTAPWPVSSIDEVFQEIAIAADIARGNVPMEDKGIQLARIIRKCAEICDGIPTSMEKMANVSLLIPE